MLQSLSLQNWSLEKRRGLREASEQKRKTLHS